MAISNDEYEELRSLLATMRARRNNIPTDAPAGTFIAGYWLGLGLGY